MANDKTEFKRQILLPRRNLIFHMRKDLLHEDTLACLQPWRSKHVATRTQFLRFAPTMKIMLHSSTRADVALLPFHS